MENTEILRITFAGSITLFSVLLAVIYVKLQANSGRKSPPGPRGLPILGNALQVPKQVSRYHSLATRRTPQLSLSTSTLGDTFEGLFRPMAALYH